MSPTSRALITGVSKYPAGISSLPAVAADVREIANLLSSPNGAFNGQSVTLLADKDATGARINAALHDVLTTAATDDTVFVYLAGHGCLDAAGNYYFIPYDAQTTQVSATAIPLGSIKQLFDQSPSERLLLWFDFCHSGGILSRDFSETSGATASATIARTLEVVRGRGKIIMCACTADQKAYEDAAHGHFTRYLVRGLRGDAANAAGEVTASSLHDYIDHKMGSDQQRPMFFGTMTGRIVLMHSRGVGASSAPLPETTPVQPIVSDSGKWVMLGGSFFAAESVRHSADGTIDVHVAGGSAEEDAAVRSLRSGQPWNTASIPFAHRNDAQIVQVRDVESESSGSTFIWNITLVPDAREYGGSLMSEMGVGASGTGRSFTADEIAELRARLLLLNEPPPRLGDPGGMLDAMVRGLNTPMKAEGAIFRSLKFSPSEDPLRFLQLARLAAIFALKASNVFEHVLELTLGPLRDGKLHVKCRGRRRKIFTNREATMLMIEGDCLLD